MSLQPLPATQAEATRLVGVSPELRFQQVHVLFGFPGLPWLGEASRRSWLSSARVSADEQL